jgi:hypothetical protein
MISDDDHRRSSRLTKPILNLDGQPSRGRAGGLCERREGEPWSCVHRIRLLLLVEHHVELQIRRLPLVQLLLREVLLGVVGRLVGVADVSGSGSDQLVDLVGVLELGTVDLRALGLWLWL